MDRVILIFLVAPFLLYYLVSMFDKAAFKNLKLERKLNEARVFQNEECSYIFEITNKKILPLTWIEIESNIPMEMTIKSQKLLNDNLNNQSTHYMVSSLLWYQKLKRSYGVCFNKRGYYRLKDITVRTGDYFGLKKYEKIYNLPIEIIVYPIIKPIDTLVMEYKSLQGENLVHRWIMDDPTYFSGVREYTYREPLKMIHWMATARTGNIQVKQNQYTSDRSVIYILNVQCYEVFWRGNDSKMVDKLVEICSSYVENTQREGVACGFATNSSIPGEKFGTVMLAPSLVPGHFTHIFDCLAKTTPLRTVSIEDTINQVTSSLDRNTVICLITPFINKEILDSIENGNRKGFSFKVVTTKENIDKNIEISSLASVFAIREEVGSLEQDY
jgi:hypothetical protein